MLKKTVSPQRGKRIDVQQRDKSHVGSQKKEKHVKHVVDLIKMVKKTMGPQRGQKTRKEKNFCSLFTPLVNKAVVHKEAKKRKKTKSLFLFFCCTIPFFLRWTKLFLHKFPLLGSSKHNVQQMPLATK
jgi:hypothetical protein